MKYASLILLVSIAFLGASPKDTLHIGIAEGYYPFSYQDSLGEPEGILVDWWELWAKRNETPISFTSYPSYAKITQAIGSGEPVFVGKTGKEEFFIRASVSSQPLGLRECHEYIEKPWRRKARC